MTQAMQSQQPGNIGETTLPMSAFETPVRSDDGFAGFPPEGQAYPAAVARSHKPLIITLIVVASLLLALVAAFFAARWYFSDRVAPGVHFGTVNVTGQSRERLADTVTQAVSDSAITVRDANGRRVKASLKDLGVNVDVSATVDELLGAKSASNLLEDVTRLNPFARKDVPLMAQRNTYDLTTFLSDKLIAASDRAVPSSIAYDGESHAFAATEGKTGMAPDSTKVIAAVKQAIAKPGAAAMVSVRNRRTDMPISLHSARQAADEANRRLNNTITMSNGDARQFDLPADEIAKWIKPDSEPGKGRIVLSYDQAAIKSYMSSQLAGQLDQDLVSQEDIVDSNGKVVIAAATKGVDEVRIKNTDAAAAKTLALLEEGNGGTVQVDADVKKFDVKQKKSEWRAVVDKSTQTATFYKNGEFVRSFNVCTGDDNHQTDNGTWYVWLKYRTQDMTGPNDDGSRYLIKGVTWVSYFTKGGEAFHTASWNNTGIATGNPSVYGSHGCVNMYEADAQWVYDNCPEGTVVEVIGSQPSGAVR